MREATLWISGAAFAFFVTAGAFLLLANLGTGPAEKSLPPDPRPAESGPALELRLDEDRLASLRALPGQELELGVSNPGSEDLSNVNLTLEVSSENTAFPDTRYYRSTLAGLAAGSSETVRFYVDLSSQEGTTVSSSSAVPEPSRKILEVRATTPEGVTAIKTAIVPL